MNTENLEIELKFPIKNNELVKEFLNKNGELISKDIYQKDIYYTPFHRNFMDEKYPYEWLRIRVSDKGSSINFKHYYPEHEEVHDYCEEYETKVEDTSILEKIFENINITELVTVEKRRTTWMYKDVEIVLDEVTDLGSFIELELKKVVDDPYKGREYLYEVLKDLNADIGEEDQRGYPYLLLEKNQKINF